MRATKYVLIAGVVLAAACAKKPKPADLPPPPPPPSQSAQPAQPPVLDAGPVGSTNAPGSAADFAASTQGQMVHFGYDSYELDGPSRAILDSQGQWLKKYPSTKITVEGHADERGTREYNLALGERRADAVKSYLAGHGFASGNIATISYGKERPLAEGSDESAWAQNRRAATDIGGPTG